MRTGRAQPQLALGPGAGVLEVSPRYIPLVEGEDGRASRPHRHLGHPEVLGGEPLGGIADDDRRVGTLRGALGAQLGVVADRAGNLAPPAKSSGVDEDDPLAVDLRLGVDRVAGGPRPLGDDHPLGAEQGVEQRGFSDVRAPEDRDPGQLLLGLGLRRTAVGPKLGDDPVK